MEKRTRSKIENYLHLVWATRRRIAALSPEWETQVHRCIVGEAERLGCKVLAIGGMPDHVHLLVRLAPTIGVAKLAQQVKGVSSSQLNSDLPPMSEIFRWESGYACFSVSRSHLSTVQSYVLRQKERHAAGKVWEAWEEVNEEVAAT